MATPARKIIQIPEFIPLWAMKRCWGPTHGPLAPTPVPIDVIGELLKQGAPNTPTIYEVKPNPKGRGFMNPVRLTLKNYTLPYDDIVGGKTEPDWVKVEEVRAQTAVVEPQVVAAPTFQETASLDTPTDFPVSKTEDNVVVTTPADPFAGMSKAERRAARRAAKEAAEHNDTSVNEETNAEV